MIDRTRHRHSLAAPPLSSLFAMGNSSGKAMANYERNLAEWQAECEAMRVEEKRLARDNKPDDCRRMFGSRFAALPPQI